MTIVCDTKKIITAMIKVQAILDDHADEAK